MPSSVIDGSVFEFERLDVYHVSLEFYDLAREIIRELLKGYA
jgi:hypothetical protein